MREKLILAGFLAVMFLVIAGIFAGIAHAAELTPGTIHISIQNKDGKAIENATVKIINNSSQILGEYKTNKSGEVDISGLSNFTGVIQITADGYKEKDINITYNNTKSYSYEITLEYDSLTAHAKSIYEEHKTAVIAGGAVIFFIIVLLVLGKSKRIRW